MMQSNMQTQLSNVQVDESSEQALPLLHQPFHCDVTGSGVPADTRSATSFVACLDGEVKDDISVTLLTSI